VSWCSKSFTVNNFCCNRKYDFLLVINCHIKLYLSPFARYSIANRKTPHPSLSPRSRGPLSNFAFKHTKLKVKTFCYFYVKTEWSYLQSSCHNTFALQTTERQTTDNMPWQQPDIALKLLRSAKKVVFKTSFIMHDLNYKSLIKWIDLCLLKRIIESFKLIACLCVTLSSCVYLVLLFVPVIQGGCCHRNELKATYLLT